MSSRATSVQTVSAKPPLLAWRTQTQHMHSTHACSCIWPHVHVTVVYHRFCLREICEWHVCANLFRSIAEAKPLCQMKIVTKKIVDQHPGLSCKQQMETTCLSIQHARPVCLLNPTWVMLYLLWMPERKTESQVHLFATKKHNEGSVTVCVGQTGYSLCVYRMCCFSFCLTLDGQFLIQIHLLSEKSIWNLVAIRLFIAKKSGEKLA